LGFVLLGAALAVADWNPILIADTYINLGELNDNPSSVNCTKYAELWLPDGTLHSPGIPNAQGFDSIVLACNASHAQVDPLISFQTLNIPVMSWNTEKRLGFSWVINGVRTSDSQSVYAPAITAMFMDTNAVIQDAWSFYDDNLIKTGIPTIPPFNSTNITLQYTNLGNFGNTKTAHNCTAWASLFTADGISNEPGIPPSKGTGDLIALCKSRVARWKVFLPSVQVEIPVMSWNTEKRLAFQWTITGQDQSGETYIVPAISVLFMNKDYTIYEAWDWWDDRALPPPPPIA